MGLIEPANIAAIVVASTSTSNLSNADLIAPGVTVEIVERLNARLGKQAYPTTFREYGGKTVARDRYRFPPHDANLRYFLRLSA